MLLIVVLLLLAAGVYYLLSHGLPKHDKPSTATTEVRTGKHLDVPATNAFTYNTDMIEYSKRDMLQNRDQVCAYMSSYINEYLADRNYSNARVPMMDRVRHYAEGRMGELLGERFAVQRFLPYDDYIYDYNEPFLKLVYASKCRHQVQGELMSYALLDSIFEPMVDELRLLPDGEGRKTAVQEPQPKQPERSRTAPQRQPQGNDPVFVYVGKDSKQGFDIIAGFYLNRSTAAHMTARLHELGCDAYIIEKNDGYYVSMGSAKTRTQAEATMKHIKSWYDGDVSIKEW